MIAAMRRLTDPLRPRLRPSFLIIGAQKAGTSALYKMLCAHPRVLPPVTKELHFFDDDATYAKGITHYRSLFPMAPLRGGKVTFEATPAYLFVEPCAARIHQHLPTVRMVAVLRDPVKRAYSAWNMFRDFKDDPVHGRLHDPRSFEQAVEDELSGKPVRWEHRYLARGNYAEQLQRFFNLFGREPLLVARYNDLKRDPARVVDAVLRHVGLPPLAFPEAALRTRDNVRSYPQPLDPELAERLYDHFAPHAEALRILLGEDLDLDERKATDRP